VTDFVPTVSADQVERIRAWHLSAYQAMKDEGAGGQTFDYLGRTLIVPPARRTGIWLPRVAC
jgi:release factor glutamine methyltransferase